MSNLIFLLLLTPAAAQPCDKAQELRAGVAAPCTGILLGLPMAKAAANCRRVELPKCEAVAIRNAHRCAAEKNGLIIKLTAAESALNSIEPEGWWERPLLASSSLAVGLVVGFLVAGAL